MKFCNFTFIHTRDKCENLPWVDGWNKHTTTSRCDVKNENFSLQFSLKAELSIEQALKHVSKSFA